MTYIGLKILATFTNNYHPSLFNVTVQTTTFYQVTSLSCSPLLIGRDIGDLKKPHHGSLASDPMSYISNDMINTDNKPFIRPIILLVANKAINKIVHFSSL